MSLSEIILQLALAMVLGALVGIERQWRQRMAGLRTNALVALGAATFTLVGMLADGEVSPTRAAAQVASGIGFLGAGVILREGINVRGLNTAATLWCSAGVGVLAGAGYPLVATVAAALILLANVGLRPVTRYLNRTPSESATEVETAYVIRARCPADREALVRALVLQGLQGSQLQLLGVESSDLDERTVEVRAELRGEGRHDSALEKVVGRLSLEPAVQGASWRVQPA